MSNSIKIAGAALCLSGMFAVAAAAQTPAPAAGAAAQQATPDATFTRWDKDKNKSLSLDEFKAGWQEAQTTAALRKLRANFNAMDANKSGGLEASEYAKLELIKRAGANAPMMSAFDADKNQALDFKEYVSLINSMVANNKR